MTWLEPEPTPDQMSPITVFRLRWESEFAGVEDDIIVNPEMCREEGR